MKLDKYFSFDFGIFLFFVLFILGLSTIITLMINNHQYYGLLSLVLFISYMITSLIKGE